MKEKKLENITVLLCTQTWLQGNSKDQVIFYPLACEYWSFVYGRTKKEVRDPCLCILNGTYFVFT